MTTVSRLLTWRSPLVGYACAVVVVGTGLDRLDHAGVRVDELLVDLGELLARVVRADRLREGGRVGPAADVGGGQRDVAVRGLAGGRDLVDVAIGPPAVAQHGFEVDPQFLS